MRLPRGDSRPAAGEAEGDRGLRLRARALLPPEAGRDGRGAERHPDTRGRAQAPLHGQGRAARDLPLRPVRGAAGRHPRAALLVGYHWKARGGGLHRRRHGHVERVHRSPRADGRRRARGHRPDGLRLRHVHRRFRPALRAAAPGLRHDPRGLGQHRAPYPDDRGLRHHRARGHALLRHAHLRGGGEDGLRLGEVPPARGPFRRRALPAGPESRDRAAHAHRLHRQLRPHRGHGAGGLRRVSGRALPAAHRRGSLPVGGHRSGNRRAGGAEDLLYVGRSDERGSAPYRRGCGPGAGRRVHRKRQALRDPVHAPSQGHGALYPGMDR